jgi:hypothetical protein
MPKNLNLIDFFIQKIFNTQYKWFFWDPNKTGANIATLNNFYCVNIHSEYKRFLKIIKLSLLSTLFVISIELNARRTFGSGALDTATFDIENILILNPYLLSNSEIDKLSKLYDTMVGLKFQDFNDAIKNNHRIQLDTVIFECLKLINTYNDLNQLYNSISEIIAFRLNKVKSFIENF